MKTTAVLFLAALLAGPLRAADSLTTLLQKGLFEEEANQNLEAAIQSYRALADQFGESRKIAATAVFRLGECYRKLGRTNDAITQYRAILRDYSDQPTLVNLSRQNLNALGENSTGGGNGTAAVQAQLAGREDSVARLRQAMAQLKDEASVQALVVAKVIEPDPVLNTLTEQRLQADQELVRLSESFGVEHPQRKSAQARRDTIVKQIADRIDAIRSGLAARLAAEEAVVAMLRQEANLSRTGAPAAGSKPVMSEEEEKELRRISVLIRDSPDLINSSANFGPTLLQTAVARGQVHVVRELLAHGADPNLAPVPANSPPPLHQAAGAGHTAVVTELVNGHADVNGRNATGETPLHLAASGGFRVLAETLIARGADLNATDNRVETPLHKAARVGHKAVAEMLLQRGAKVDMRSDAGETPLYRAAENGHAALVNLLAGAGASVNLTNKLKQSPLYIAVANGQIRAVETLLALRADVELAGPDEAKPLHRAAGDLRESVVEVLLKAGANPNATNRWGSTPLLQALLKQNMSPSDLPAMRRVVERLLESGASPNPPGTRANPPIHIALERRAEGLVPLLLRYKPDLEARDDKGFSALERAIIDGRGDIVQGLLDAGANPNATHPTNGETPLHWAVQVGDPKLVTLLLDQKANPNATTLKVQTPLTAWRDEWTSARPGPMRDATARAKAAGIPDLLRAAGAEETYHLRQVISVRKRSGNYNYTRVIFRPDTNGWNRFTLLELIAQVYSDRSSEPADKLVFPDLARVRLARADARSAATNAVVDVRTLLRATNCAGDVALSPGDIVEIGETNHTVSAQWGGFDDPTRDALSRCLIRYVEIVVGEERTRVRLFPWFQQHHSQRSLVKHGGGTHENISPNPADGVEWGRSVFWLSYLLRDFNQLLRVSSDTSRVRVRRTDPATGAKQEFLFDLPAFHRQPDETRDIRLRDGDVIEVPEK